MWFAVIAHSQERMKQIVDLIRKIAGGPEVYSLNRKEEEVLAMTGTFLDKGLLRRLAAILYHQKAGFTGNAVGVWSVPEEMIDETAPKLASFKEVSHCYQRPCPPGFSYKKWLSFLF